MTIAIVGAGAGNLRDWMYDFFIRHLRDDRWFYNLLDRDPQTGPDQPLTLAEQDRAEMFKAMIDGLVALLGNEEQAANWLIHESEFRRFTGSDPLDYIETGNFLGIGPPQRYGSV